MFEGYTKKKLIVTKNQGLDVSLNLGSSSLADGSKWTDWIVAVIINSRKLIPWQCETFLLLTFFCFDRLCDYC
ncbi:hypothetical protein HanXRQr2_Chr13g0568571 [Helianthus annuus]|uniref:Uncharacterized protein n=1 Tax=Helianthus annuus TaxID=4232 RepID=A0A9K3EEJ3_HELAN|nr:hypothetical protein HanXRQr2_Chr13g0568571 [Helianthus annuus]KAJ0839343.1 hypothetical protein HanPSC8_Chr14g0605711 [Helianthus annuus]